MELPNTCREVFLDGITDIYIYPVHGSSFPIPNFVAGIQMMNTCQLPAAALHIATHEGDDTHVVASNIKGKASLADTGKGIVYTYNITCNVDFGGNNAREAQEKMKGKDHLVVLKKKDDTLNLLYTLAGSFSFRTSADVDQSGETRTATIATQALSDLIPIKT